MNKTILFSGNTNNLYFNSFVSKNINFSEDFFEFIRFKNNKLKLYDSKETKLNDNFEIINWFIYKINTLLVFNVCKLKNIKNKKNIYLMFHQKYYKFINEEDVSNKELKNISDNKIYNIKIKERKESDEISVQHYKKFINFNDFINNLKNLECLKIENKPKTSYILKSDLFINFDTKCINNFKNISHFFLEYNIDPSGFYNLKNLVCNKFYSDYEEIYLVKDENIYKCFENKIQQVENPKHVLSFDIESRIDSKYDIESEKNIITHIGIEFYCDKSFTNFNTCFINLDYYIACEIEKNKSNLENVYYKILEKKIDVEKYIKKIKNESFILENFYNSKEKYVDIFRNKKYIFVKELCMIKLVFELFYILEPDYILSYNGNVYDYQQMIKRNMFLEKKKINITGKMFYTLNKQLTSNYFQMTENKVTKFSITNMFVDTPYILIDILNYTKIFNSNFNSFKLENVCHNYFNLKFKIEEIIHDQKKTYLLIPLEKNKDKIKTFYTVLLTSNFCYINNETYPIVSKKFINNTNDIYNIDLDNITDFRIMIENKNILDKEEIVYLSKDDLLLTTDIFNNENVYDIAKYCIHDAVLCRYLYQVCYINYKISSFAKYYLLPQCLCFAYRNSTNFLGQLLKSLLDTNSFLINTKKIKTGLSTGGKVFEPLKTFIKEPIVLLDFRSLYPSIIINYNISPDCLELVLHLNCKTEYSICESIIKTLFSNNDYTIIFNNTENNYLIMVFNKKKEGILNGMLKRLLQERKGYKDLMKNTKEEFLKNNYDMLQNTIKILSNSVYGFLGSEFSILSCNFSSQAITNIGSNSLIFTKNILDKSKISNKKILLDVVLEENFITKEKLVKKQEYDLEMFDIDQNLNLEVVYGDTDSLFISVNNLNFDNEKELVKYLSLLGHSLVNFLHKNFLKSKLIIEFEDIMLETILIAKKKYRCIKIKPFNMYDKKIKEIEEIDKIHFNSGISLKRRDNCLYQKKIINIIFNKIESKLDIIKTKIVSDEPVIVIDKLEHDFGLNENEKKIFKDIKQYLYKNIKYLIKGLILNNINSSDFIVSMSYKGEYKFKDNVVHKLIKEYNENNNNEKILKGDRFEYCYAKNFDKEKNIKYINFIQLYKQNKKNEEIKEIYKNKFKNNLHVFIDWCFIEEGVNNYIEICGNNIETVLSKNNKRIYVEIYIRKIIKDVLTIFKNKPEIKIFLKDLIKQMKSFNKTKIDEELKEKIEPYLINQ